MPKIKDYLGPKGAQQITTVIKAGQVFNTKSPAASFFLVDSTGDLKITPENRGAKTYHAGTGEAFDLDSELPENLQINNESGVDVTFTLWFGFGTFLDKRLNVTIAGNVTISGQPINTVDAAAEASLASIDGKTPALVGGAVPVSLPAGLATSAKQDLQPLQTQLPAALDANRLAVGTAVVGEQGNAWNAAAVGAGGTSAAIATLDRSVVSCFGHVDAATTITVQVSEDNATFYDTTTTAVLAGVADFHVSFTSAAKYIRLKSSGAANITATVAAK